jgi:hypothetical protein
LRILAVVTAVLAAVAVEADEAIYRMRGDVLPQVRAVNGYALDTRRLDGGWLEVRVTTSLGPVGARGSLAEVTADGRPELPPGFTLPATLRSELSPDLDAWQAATLVLGWVSDHLELVEDDHRPQDAISVLGRRGGRCSGLANATAALLLGAGFEARTVSGLLITGREAIPHRWVECRLPGAGWVPTDPTLGWWIITPRHVAFADTVATVPRIEVIRSAAGELHRLPRNGVHLVRPNLGAELVCRLDNLDDERTVVARLRQGTDRRLAVIDPQFRFSSLLPGRWVLEVELDGRLVERRELTLRSGTVHSYVVRLPSQEPEEVGS